MEPFTITILSQYDYDSDFIDISNKNIKGTLDLSNYKIKKLICSNNKIVHLIN